MATSKLLASKLFSPQGLIAVITGGGTGIGRTFAKALAHNGAKTVYVIGRRLEPLKETASLAPGNVIVPIQGDVTSKESLQSIADRIKAEQGYIDVLIANAGVNGPHHSTLLAEAAKREGKEGGEKPSLASFQEAMWSPPIEDFTHALHVNCSSVFYSTLAFLPLLDAGNERRNAGDPKSQVIILSSGAAVNRGVGAGFAYSISKTAAQHLAMMLSTYFLPYHIRVNCIAPGVVATDLTAHRFKRKEGQLELFEEGGVSEKILPAGRTGAEEDLAGAVLYLTGPAGGYVNGAVVLVDGGKLSMGV